jgi:hypothetical protein
LGVGFGFQPSKIMCIIFDKKNKKLFFPRNDGTFQRNHEMEEWNIKLKE